jgi:hypothetical protein
MLTFIGSSGIIYLRNIVEKSKKEGAFLYEIDGGRQKSRRIGSGGHTH